MCLLQREDFVEAGALLRHEDAREAGKLRFFDDPTEVAEPPLKRPLSPTICPCIGTQIEI